MNRRRELTHFRNHIAAQIDDFGLWPDEGIDIVVRTNEYKTHAVRVIQPAAIAAVSA
ncbi:MAG: hypothetical protein V3S70_08460 [Gammaproteobacteria bacterium]